MTAAVLGATTDTAEPASRRISGAAVRLMVGYCDAIDACRSLRMISGWPLARAVFQTYVWLFALELALLCLFVDVPLLLLRLIFGRPRFLLGRIFYRYSARPFRAVWSGEVPLFQIAHARYLTRVILYYHARVKIDVLHDALNRRHLEILSTAPDAATLEDTEKLQRSFDVFEKITEDRFKIKSLVVFGPIVTIVSLVTQKLVLPLGQRLLNFFADQLGFETSDLIGQHMMQNAMVGAGLVVLYAVWLVSSAWMDKRAILKRLGIYQLERSAFADARAALPMELPVDIIGLLAVSLGFSCLPFWSDLYSWFTPVDTPDSQQLEQRQTIQGEAILFGGLTVVLGVIALLRRLRLSRSGPG